MKEKNEFVAKYVTDQLILDSHTLKVIEVQLKDSSLTSMPQVQKLLQNIHSVIQKNINALQALDKSNNKNSSIDVSKTLSETLTDVTGTLTGLYNKLRTEKVSKMLRDDYTALSMTCLTYSMLFTTAKGLGEHETAEVATNNLKVIPPLVMDLNSIIPGVVLFELEQNGYTVDKTADSEAVQQSRQAWNQKEG